MSGSVETGHQLLMLNWKAFCADMADYRLLCTAAASGCGMQKNYKVYKYILRYSLYTVPCNTSIITIPILFGFAIRCLLATSMFLCVVHSFTRQALQKLTRQALHFDRQDMRSHRTWTDLFVADGGRGLRGECRRQCGPGELKGTEKTRTLNLRNKRFTDRLTSLNKACFSHQLGRHTDEA